jgi:hypothetical protein
LKLIANRVRLQYDENRQAEIVISTKQNIQAEIEELKVIVAQGKELSVEVKQYRHKRSLDANAYLWVILNQMASILHTTKDELYIEVLQRYGQFTHVVVKPNAVEKFKQEWKLIKELGEVTINGQTGMQLQCYFGSSIYDTKEMSTLIDGVVQEAKGMGIDTMTPRELEVMKSQWGGK